MKIVVTLKDPDGFSEGVEDAVHGEVSTIRQLDDGDELVAIAGVRLEKVWEKLAKFVEHQEYLTVEFDTEAGTAIVLPTKR